MKKIIYILTLPLLLLASCNVLDTDDLANYGPGDVWNDEKLANAYLVDLYSKTFGGWPLNGGMSDETTGIWGTNAVEPNNGTQKPWGYTNIRSINVLLKEIKTGTLPDAQKNPIIGQALFMRAFHYFNMVRVYGGMPYITEPQSLTEDLNVKRNTSKECFDLMIKDLDDAFLLLPVRYKDKNFGRIDQCVVSAFKGRMLLYMASPQFNSGNPYGNAYWVEALKATKSAKELLEAQGFGLVDSYADIFLTERHKEVVLAVVYTEPSKTNGRQEHAVRPLSESKNATGADQPTWGLVEAYPMKDGLKAGMSTKYPFDLQRFWENRDPRFDATIAYNGGIYALSGKTGRRQYTMSGIAQSVDAFGYNIQGESFARSGLYCRKGIMESLPAAQAELNDVDWLEIRYAEVLFNYAEASNETGGIDIAYETLKAIRKRAGIEPGAQEMYGLKAGMSHVEMRIALLDEKRIEFSFEGQRFWDLRRHRLLHTYLNGQHKFGIMAALKDGLSLDEAINLSKTYSLMPGQFKYTVVDLRFHNPTAEDAMYMPESYYFFPLAKDQIEKNPNLEQNIHWGGNFDPTLP